MEKKIKWHPEKPVIGMEGSEYAPANAGIDQLACFLEQDGCFGPGHVVEIARNHHGQLLVTHPLGNAQQFAVTLLRVLLFRRAWRRRMDAEKQKAVTIGGF